MGVNYKYTTSYIKMHVYVQLLILGVIASAGEFSKFALAKNVIIIAIEGTYLRFGGY